MPESDSFGPPFLDQSAKPLPWTKAGPNEDSKSLEPTASHVNSSVADPIFTIKNRVVTMKDLEALKKSLPSCIDVRITSKIKDFILKHLPANKLYRQATVDFLRKYQNHRESHLIATRIKRWAKDIRYPDHYKAFVKAILLDTLFRYPFIDLKRIDKREQDQAVKLWAEVMGRLSRVYFEVRSLGFDYSALGLFSEINRIGGCMNSLKPNQEKYDFLIRTWDDIADADSVNFALLGKNQQQVHIVTLEKKVDIERRLICLAENLRDMETRGFKTNFYPGTVTIFSPTFEEVDFFSVQEVISRR